MPEEAKPTTTEKPSETSTEPVPEKQPQDSPAPAKPDSTPESTQTAPEPSSADEVANLRTALAKAQMERTAAIEAVKLGIDPKQVPYVLRLAELPSSGKTEDITAAIQKVLDDVPAFRAEAPGSRPEIRIGAKAPQETETNDALARAFGNVKKK